MTQSKPRPLATPEQVAEWLQITPERLKYLRKTGRAPKAIGVGRQTRYAWPDVHAWAVKNREAGK